MTKYQIARERADRISNAVNSRARKACQDAGLDPNLLGIHPHNAMVSYNAGKPWPEVDYSKVRLCLRLLDKQFDAGRILDRWTSKMTREHGCTYIHS